MISFSAKSAEFNKRTMIELCPSKGPRSIFRAFCIFSFLTLGLSSFLVPSLYAQVQQWDFQAPDEYQYDRKKVDVVDGIARLSQNTPYRDEGSDAFDRGHYVANAWSARDTLEITPYSLSETGGMGPAFPLNEKTPGLLALWNFDEPSGTNVLDRVGKNVAKVSDAEVVSGQTGFKYARLFDGIKSHVFIPHYHSLQFEVPFTLEAWVRPVATINSKPQTIISRWQTVAAQKSFALQLSMEGKVDFQVSADGATTTQHLGDTVLTPGFWYHIAVVATGHDLRIYLNGTLDSEPTPFTGNIFQSTNPIYIGALVNNRVDELFEGVIDEVAFYNRALTSVEAMTHYGNAKGMVGLWHLNERGGILADRSGYENNLVAYGDPTYEAQGKFANAIHVNGKKQYLETPASFQLGPDGAMSFSGWINPDKLPSKKNEFTIFSSVGGESSYSLSILSDGRLATRAPSLIPTELKSHTTVMPNVWQHVAATWGNGVARVYINGLLDGETEYKGFLRTGKVSLRLGKDDQKAYPFYGSFDEVSVYRRVLTPAEISRAAGLFAGYGIYDSTIKDAGGATPWQSISWQEELPYGEGISVEQRGLIHLYPLDEKEPEINLMDDAFGETDLNAVGSYPVPGKFGRARWFAEKGYDKLISQKPMPSLSTFTISGWFQFANSEPGISDRLFSIGDENPSVYRAAPDGHLNLMMTGSKKLVSATPVRDTQWHHLAVTSDGNQLFLYLDGVLDAHAPVTSATGHEPLVLGNLKTSDTFRGALDDFAVINYALEQEDIINLFLAGKVDVKLLVRSSDDPKFTNTPWVGPKGNARIQREVGGATVGLWRFTDHRLFERMNEVTDASRFENHGYLYGNIQRVAGGVVGEAVEFNGAGDFIEIPDSPNLHLNDQLTLSAWIKPYAIESQGARILDKRYRNGVPVFSSFSLELAQGNRLALRLGRPGGYHVITTDRDGEIAINRWNHVVATYDRHQVKLYINGKLKKAMPVKDSIPYDDGALFIGRYGNGESGYFYGAIDEVSLDSVALSDHDVESIFLKADPENFYTRSIGSKLSVPAGRYFQYQVHLSSDYPYVSPTLGAVEVSGSSFAADSPFVINEAAVSFADVSGFRELVGPGHQGGITYQISNDGRNWFYHNGRHWVIAASTDESNTADQINTRIKSFAKDVGIGSFYFKAFLHSTTGLDMAELEAVEIEYLPNKLTLLTPNGAEAWLVGTDQEIRWNSAGEINKVRLEYSQDGFKEDFFTIAKDIPNEGTYTWAVPDDIGPQTKIRVSDSLDPRIHDTSDLSFRIVGALELVAPNWQERWQAGTEQEITWRTLGNIPNVKLEYSLDNFTDQVFPIVDSVKNEGAYTWLVPDHLSPNVRVRVSDLRDPLVQDASNDIFAIHGDLNITAPAEHARLSVGSPAEIRWETMGTIPTVKIEYALMIEGEEPEWRVVEELYSNRGAYQWDVPDEIYPSVLLKISDPNDENVFSVSSPFAIVGGLVLQNPQGGEMWTVGSRRKIAWKYSGTIPNIAIEYATLDEVSRKDLRDGVKNAQAELDWQFVEESLPNIGSYIWEVPDALSDQVVLRISDSRDPFVSDVLEKPFRIIPGFILQVPNGGESFEVGKEVVLSWETRGSIENVRLQYSKDNFVSDVQEIIGEASNVGRFTWTIPDDLSPQVWVRVLDPRQTEAADTSDAPFRIYGDFELIAPSGGEKFEVGSLATIQWNTRGSVENVRLEYSADDFVKDVRVIAESLPNTGAFQWKVPDDIGSSYQLRISDVDDLGAQIISNGPFSIVGNFHLVQPAGGDNVIVGTLMKIKWKGAASVPVVRIDYSEDDFTRSFTTLADAAPNTGEIDWEVPNRIGQTFKIRIWDPSDPDSMYVMPTSSRIVGGFNLHTPNGGEALYVGAPYDIKWQSFGSMPRVRLEFSNDNFNKNVYEIADHFENISSYQWMVPDVPSGSYKVRISDPKDASAFDISNSDFRIRSKITVLSPKGGEGWQVGQKKTIKWQTSGSVENVLIEYSNDNFETSEVIAESAPNTGIYNWTVPDYVSENLKIRVSDLSDPTSHAISQGAARIQGILDIISPNGNEVWKVGSQYPITWASQGEIGAVRLEYSRDGFVSEVKTIMASVDNTGVYTWTVPDDISPQSKIRVLDVDDHMVQDVSDQTFQTVADFKMMGPNGGEIWHATEKREIIWVTVGTVPEVNLSFCKVKKGEENNQLGCGDNETISIDTGIHNSGRYIWDLPALTGTDLKVQVCDARHPSVCDATDGVFEVVSPFEIVYPRERESWTIGSEQEIRWHTYGEVYDVAVEYTLLEKAPGPDWNPESAIWQTLVKELNNKGNFLFTVPDAPSKYVVFKVADWMDESLYSVSKHAMKFVGDLNVISPNGGEAWAAGTSQPIVWDTTGTVSNVRLEYSTDNFVSDVKLIEAIYPNTGRYDWTLPAELSKTFKVRVLDESDSEVMDVSDDYFKVMAGFILLSPNGGEKWIVGSKQKIRWKTLGDVDHVKLEYFAGVDSTGFERWRSIAEKTDNDQEYEWTVPNEVTQEIRIRIQDVEDPDALVSSQELFEIKPDVVVTRPNGKEIFYVGKPGEIKWASIGSLGDVKIEYSRDNFESDINLIAEKVADRGSYFWMPTDDVTESAKIRVTSLSDKEVLDLSDQPFKILPQINVVNPVETAKWGVGTEQTLVWDWRGTMNQVKIEYSINDFDSTEVLKDVMPNVGRYVFKVPNHVYKTIKFRVRDFDHPETFGDSVAEIKIIPHFEILSPNGGEKWKVGEKQQIEWQTSGTSARVILEYLPNANFPHSKWKAITGADKNNGRYIWTIPTTVSSYSKIRVVDSVEPDAFDESNENFKILGDFNILRPTADEILIVGSMVDIAWETTGGLDLVKLEYVTSRDIALPLKDIQPKPIVDKIKNEGLYKWSVPDDMAEFVWLKISDAREPDTYRFSESPFKIRGELELLLPSGPKNWFVNSVQTLNWNSTGTIPLVDLQYSIQNKSPWKTIVKNAPNSGSYGWTIPMDVSNEVKLRIQDSRNPLIYDEQDDVLSIGATFDITTPSENDLVRVGDELPIIWKTSGEVNKVWLEFSTGREWFPIVGPLPNGGSYTWKVPDRITTNATVKIYDGDNDDATAISKPFMIAGKLKVTEPTAQKVLKVGSVADIRWQTVGTIPEVTLAYIVGNPRNADLSFKEVIHERIPNTGSFSWTVPNNLTDYAKIRVSDYRNDQVFSVSEMPFTIIGDIQLTSPSGGERLLVGETREITWTSSGTIETVKLEYSLDDFNKDVRTIAENLPNTGTAAWIVPDAISDKVKARISDQKDSRSSSVSPRPFSIEGALKVVEPEAGEVWKVSERHMLRWNTTGNVPFVRLEYSRDGFDQDIQVIANTVKNSGEYEWVIPNAISDAVQVRIVDADNKSLSTITPPIQIQALFTFKTPKTETTFKVNETMPITWETAGTVPNVQLEFSRDGFKKHSQIIKQNLENKGYFEWAVPEEAVSESAKLRIVDARNSQSYQTTDYSLKLKGDYKITLPKGGEVLHVGDRQQIVWETLGPNEFVDLAYYTEPHGNPPVENTRFIKIAENLKNDGTYFWTVPDSISDYVWLKVSDSNDKSTFNVTTEPFKIRGKVKLEFGDKPMRWQVDSVQTIRWTTTGSISHVDLQYQSGPDQPWKTFAKGIANTGTFGWRVPLDAGNNIRVRIQDAFNPLVADKGSSEIAVEAGFHVYEPQKDKTLLVGEDFEIQWHTTGRVGDVGLEYSLGEKWFPITGAVANKGSFIWTVPDRISSFVRVKVYDLDNPNAFALSEPFKIAGKVKLLAPKGEEVWTVGSEQEIKWTSTGTIPEVRLSYILEQPGFLDPADVKSAVIADKLTNNGSYQWRVPEEISDFVKIRIEDARDASVYDIAEEPVSIIGGFSLASPKGGEQWLVGSSQEIVWTSQGKMDFVDIVYSTDNFERDIQMIGRGLPNTGLTLWKVPDVISDNVKIRISDSNDPRATAKMQAPLQITGAMVITIPGRSEVWTVGERKLISWLTTGTIPEVRLEYSRDGFTSDVQVIENNFRNSGRYEWIVPDIIANHLQIRVVDAEDNKRFALSNPLRVQGKLSLASFNDLKSFKVLGTYPIQWQTTGTIPKVNIDYSRDSFASDVKMIAANVENTGNWDWTVPDDIGAGVKIRVSDALNGDVFDMTPGFFEITGSLQLLTEGMPKRWAVGSQQKILWNSVGTIPYLRLEYATDNYFSIPKLIQDQVPNKGQYIWSVPDDISNTVYLRVVDTRNPKVESTSTEPAKIVGTLALSEPVAREVYKVGQKTPISWETMGTIPSVRLEYSVAHEEEGEEHWKIITGSTQNFGSYTWTVPDDIAEFVKVRVSDVQDPEVYSVSSVPFMIRGQMGVVQPHGGERWIVGIEHEILWETKGAIPSVNLFYSNDNFRNNVKEIARDVPNTGRYMWKVADEISDSLQIKVVDASNEAVSISSAPFSIIGDFVFVGMSEDKVWTVGSEQTLKWQTVGSVPEVRIEYHAPDFEKGAENNFRVIQGKLPNVGEYKWIVPDQIAEGVKIKIADARYPQVSVLSSALIKIQGAFELLEPKGGERWEVGSTQKVVWNTAGTIPFVVLEYSWDDFQQNTVVMEGNYKNENHYFWTIPAAISDKVTIRIRDSKDSTVAAYSKPFHIHGSLDLLQPTGSQYFTVGEVRRLEWQTTGTISSVRLEYSTDQFKQNIYTIEAGMDNVGQYHWTVPDQISEKVWVRVSDTGDPLVSSALEHPIKIQGGLQLIKPLGQKVLKVGEVEPIEWETKGSIPTVRIEYSNDKFVRNINVIENDLPNTGLYEWTVPDFIFDKVEIRVVDVKDPSVEVRSVLPFKVQGELDLLTPSEDTSLRVGAEYEIKWNAVGSVKQVRLEYSSDQFKSDVHVMHAAVPNQGSVLWSVPDEAGKNIRLRVLDVNDEKVVSYSPAQIHVHGSFEWLYPRGKEIWKVGENKTLQWKTIGTVNQVVLEYSTDGFQKIVRPIEESLLNDNQYTWNIPDHIGEKVQVRLRDAYDSTVAVASEPFKISGEINLSAPGRDSVYLVDSEQRIEWQASGTIPHYTLEYSTDGFKQDIRVIEKALPRTGLETQSYIWKVPDIISDKVWLRVSDARDLGIQGVTQEPFKVKGRIELTEPFRGDTWVVGSQHKVTWNTVGSIPAVRLEYSRDGFTRHRKSIAENIENTGFFEWTAPDEANEQVWIRVLDANDNTVHGTTQEPVNIRGGLRLEFPSGGESWTVGTEQLIKWETTGNIPQVRLEYLIYQGGFNQLKNVSEDADNLTQSRYIIIQDRLPNRGSYPWRVPDHLPQFIKVRVVDAQNSEVFSETPGPIKLKAALKFLAPNQPQIWRVGSTQEIVWESKGFMPQVRLEYSRDDFKEEVGLVHDLIANAGMVKWVIPDLITDSLKFRLSDPENADIAVTTQHAVEVIGDLKLSVPAGGEQWVVGSKNEIRWDATGSMPLVKLEYSKDKFVRHRALIAESAPNTETFEWQIPDDISNNVWVRVSDFNDQRVHSISEFPFQVSGNLYLQKPSGGEIWTVRDDVQISWDSVGSISRVRLEYSVDDFFNSVPMTGAFENEGTYTWSVPDVITDRLKIRLVDASNSAVFSTSRMPVKIQGGFQFLSPEGPEFWMVGSQHALTWETFGSIPYVNVDYSKDNFATAAPIIMGASNTGSYTWVVPDITADHILFRVSNASDQSVFTVTPAPIQVGGSLQLLNPGGGERWQVGETQEIRWRTTGTIPHVRLELSSDGFKNDIQTIAATHKNDGYFPWKIPNIVNPSLQVRVSDVRNPKIFDASQKTFKIVGGLQIYYPEGGETWPVGSRQRIQWETEGDIPQVRLDYSTDNFVTSMPITRKLVNSGFYEWDVPDLAGKTVKFRVIDAREPTVFSETTFGINIRGELQLKNPVGAVAWRVGSQQTLAWQTVGTIPNVNIEYSLDDFRTIEPIATGIANTGKFLWTVPSVDTQNLKIRVANSTDPQVEAVSTEGLQVVGKLELTRPRGNEIWIVGSDQQITWNSMGTIDQVRLEYSTDNFRSVNPIIVSLPNQGQYSWKVPDDISKEARVRVVDVSNPSVFFEQGRAFEIRGALVLNSPTGGEIWNIGDRHLISWKTQGTIPQVRLEYSMNDFQGDIQQIAPIVANKGSFYWELPSSISSNIKVRVVDAKNSDVYDQSRDDVRVAGRINLLFPNSGEVFRVGDRVNIQWRATPNIGTVKIEYSLDDFQTSQLISSGVKNTGEFAWNVPDKISNSMRLRVSDAQDSSVFSISSAPFLVKGGLQLIHPRGGEVWPVGSYQNITWQSQGSIPEVRLEYSSDNFHTAVPIALNVPNTGSYNWQVPEMFLEDISIRVSDAKTPSVEAFTLQPVQIRGGLKLATPMGGDRWITGEERVIKWETIGHIPSVSIVYSKDGFVSDVHTIAENIPNVGSHFWKIPNDRTHRARIRVMSADDRNLFSESSEAFQIDYYKITWNIRNARTGEHLTGLTFTDSTGKTQENLRSPIILEYPYGIYTTSWTKPGYDEQRSTWLADKDRTLQVNLEANERLVEVPRINFEYNSLKDVMKVTSWFERNGVASPSVTQSEVHIYDGSRLIKRVTSSNPDSRGYFSQVWDTSNVEGDKRYLASATITTSAGQRITSPISYQIDLPVKEYQKNQNYSEPLPVSLEMPKKRAAGPVLEEVQGNTNAGEGESRSRISAIGNSLKSLFMDSETAESDMPLPSGFKSPSAIQEPKQAPVAQVQVPVTPTLGLREDTRGLNIPGEAAMGETVSIKYFTEGDSTPVLDVYNANKKLIVRGQPMMPTGAQGEYSYLLPVKGIGFIPGRSITVMVIEKDSGKFKSGDIKINNTSSVMGWDQAAGHKTVLDVVYKLNQTSRLLKESVDKEQSIGRIVDEFESQLNDLALILSVNNMQPAVVEALNDVAKNLARILMNKGYDTGFLTEAPLRQNSDIAEVSNKMKDIESAAAMIARVFQTAPSY